MSRRKEYQCGVCGEVGHNARTCPVVYGHTPDVVSKPRIRKESATTETPVKKHPVEKDPEYHDPVWDDVERLATSKKTRALCLWGPPGTGKTTAANKLGNPEHVYNLTLTEETPAAEIRGHYIPSGGADPKVVKTVLAELEDGTTTEMVAIARLIAAGGSEFVWHDGPAMRAFRNGGRLVLNEIDKASSDCLTFLHALLDDPGISAITLPTGETVKPHKTLSVWGTMNGVMEDLPDALRSRFAKNREILKPHPDAIKLLPKHLQPVVWDSTTDDTLRGIGLREWLAFADISEEFDEGLASRMVFGVRASEILHTLSIRGATAASRTSLTDTSEHTSEPHVKTPDYSASDDSAIDRGRRITSRFPGHCRKCHKPYDVGDPIYWTRRKKGALCDACGKGM